MTRFLALTAVLLAMTVALVAAACGSGPSQPTSPAGNSTPSAGTDDGGDSTMDGMGGMGDGGSGMMDGSSPQGPKGTVRPDASGLATAIAGDNFFDFAEIQIPADQQITVRLENHGLATHDFMLHTEAGEPLLDGSGKEIATPFVQGGGQGEVSFSLPAGVYMAMCDLHPGEMQATVTVR